MGGARQPCNDGSHRAKTAVAIILQNGDRSRADVDCTNIKITITFDIDHPYDGRHRANAIGYRFGEAPLPGIDIHPGPVAAVIGRNNICEPISVEVTGGRIAGPPLNRDALALLEGARPIIPQKLERVIVRGQQVVGPIPIKVGRVEITGPDCVFEIGPLKNTAAIVLQDGHHRTRIAILIGGNDIEDSIGIDIHADNSPGIPRNRNSELPAAEIDREELAFVRYSVTVAVGAGFSRDILLVLDTIAIAILGKRAGTDHRKQGQDKADTGQPTLFKSKQVCH